MNYKCVVEYDGADFHGWQYQPDLRTIQGEFEKALKQMVKRVVKVVAAGRTDTGVHAEGQIVSFKIDRDWSSDIVLKGLNSILPNDVRIKSCRIVGDSFSSRFDALSREYRYRVFNDRSVLRRKTHWCTDWPVDYETLKKLAEMLRGSHDFKSFCVEKSQKESNICIISKSFWTKRGKEYTFHVVANRFLHGMVRSLVGTMMRVASGQLAEKEFRVLFERPKRSARILTAPPQGLTLMKVNYR